MNISLDLAWFLYPLVSLVLYFPCINGQPVFDDNDILPNVIRWDILKARGWKRVLRKIVTHRPLTHCSFLLSTIWPDTVRGLHLFNVVVHSLSALAVQRMGLAIGMDSVTSTLAGLVFVVHPFAVNSVAYIAGRAALLSACLGLWAMVALLSGHPVLALVALGLSIGSKEDGAGYALLLFALSLLTVRYVFASVLVVLGFATLTLLHSRLKLYTESTGDQVMSTIGLPVSLRQPQHALTVLVETLNRLPYWFAGLSTSPYHGSGIPVPPFFKFSLALFIGLFLGYLISLFPIPLLLILLGPWLIYLLCPVPDQLMEYRNYSMTAGFSLIIASIIEGLTR